MRASTRRSSSPARPAASSARSTAPDGASRGVALIAHPHPLFGGTLDNKVVQTLARAFVELGYEAWRPNFRGVGKTEGVHDEGRGELEDLAAVLEAAFEPNASSWPASPSARRSSRASPSAQSPSGSCWSASASRGSRRRRCPRTRSSSTARTTTPCRSPAVLDWARPQELPVVVVPGADHFFHRKLHVLRAMVQGRTGDERAVGARAAQVVRRARGGFRRRPRGRRRRVLRPARAERRRQDHHAQALPGADRARRRARSSCSASRARRARARQARAWAWCRSSTTSTRTSASPRT